MNWHKIETTEIQDEIEINAIENPEAKRNYEELRPFFLDMSREVVRKTFEATSQYTRLG